MISIAVIEDNIQHLFRLEKLLSKVAKEQGFQCHITTFMREEEYRKQLDQKVIYDVYFLDLDLGENKEQGFQIAKDIRTYNPYATIIFITSLSESMPLVFRYHVSALDFIPKDISEEQFEERLRICMESVFELNHQKKQPEHILNYSYQGRSGIRIPFEDILFIQTTNESHRLLLCGVNFRKEFYGTLKEIKELDTNHQLYQADRFTLLNLVHAIDVNKKEREIIFSEGTTCPISRLKFPKLKEMIMSK